MQNSRSMVKIFLYILKLSIVSIQLFNFSENAFANNIYSTLSDVYKICSGGSGFIVDDTDIKLKYNENSIKINSKKEVFVSNDVGVFVKNIEINYDQYTDCVEKLVKLLKIPFNSIDIPIMEGAASACTSAFMDGDSTEKFFDELVEKSGKIVFVDWSTWVSASCILEKGWQKEVEKSGKFWYPMNSEFFDKDGDLVDHTGKKSESPNDYFLSLASPIRRNKYKNYIIFFSPKTVKSGIDAVTIHLPAEGNSVLEVEYLKDWYVYGIVRLKLKGHSGHMQLLLEPVSVTDRLLDAYRYIDGALSEKRQDAQ